MSKNSQLFSTSRIFLISAFLFSGRIFTNLPLVFVYSSGTGAPLSSLITGIVALLLVALFLPRLCACPLTEYSNSPLDSFGKHLSSVVLFVYLFISSLYTLTQFSQLAKAVAFPTAPLWFLSLFFIIAAFLGALGGIRGVIQICGYIIPRALVVVFFILISVLLQSDTKNLLPILGNNVFDTLFRSASGIFLYSDILVLSLIQPDSQNPRATAKAIVGGCALGLFVVVAVVTVYTATIPYPLSKDEQLPLYLLMKEVYYGRFFQRSDAVFLLVSSLWGMLSLSLSLCLMAKILKNVFGVASSVIILFPLSSTIFFTHSALSSLLPRILPVASAVLLGAILLPIFLHPRKEVASGEK